MDLIGETELGRPEFICMSILLDGAEVPTLLSALKLGCSGEDTGDGFLVSIIHVLSLPLGMTRESTF